jgi:hypothetical protein
MSSKKNKVIDTKNSKKAETTRYPGWLKHVFVYAVLLVVAMFYFKPITFDGMSLQQHDNIQAAQVQTEITNYRLKEKHSVGWTNHIFGGMPTILFQSNNKNYVSKLTTVLIRPFSLGREVYQIFAILLFCYIGLSLLGVNWLVSLCLSIVLAFFTSNLIYLAAGHSGKIGVLSTTPLLIGAFVYAYKKNLLLGALIFSAALSINIAWNHIQITYYSMFGLGLFALLMGVNSYQKNELPKFGKFVGMMGLASVLALLTNIGALWPTYEYGKYSTRGKSELTSVTSNVKNASSGLTYEYVFGLSMEKGEIATLMFPNLYGGTAAKSFYSDPNSETRAAIASPAMQQDLMRAAKGAGVKGDQQMQQFAGQLIGKYTRQYRGSQTISGAPLYYGVVVCFLFILSLLVMRGVMKWAFVSAFGLYVILACGKHFPMFNDLMYYYFPLYSKFRDVKMVLLVGQPFVVLGIGLGFMELMKFDAKNYVDTWSAKILTGLKYKVSKDGYVLLAGGIALLMCALTYLYISMGTLTSPNDNELAAFSTTLVQALELDRATLAKGDIGRAVGFILAAMVLLFMYARQIVGFQIAIIGVAALACLDLNMVNKDYFGKDNYSKDNFLKTAEKQVMQKSDKDILKDTSIYKVVDYSRGAPSQTAATSSFHKSMGGYFAAKPMLYQEFWNRYQLDNPNVALQQHSNLMNMLNVKYIILDPNRTMDNPTALGNAWFVEKINKVANADEEMAALDNLNPLLEVVVNKKYESYVEGLSTDYNKGDKIYLKSYHPDTMTYQSETTKERLAVFSEMYYPAGWNVYIDGELVDPFIKANYVLRGLKVPVGKHEVKMIYEPQSIAIGEPISSFSSILILVLTAVVAFFSFKSYKDTKEEVAA